LTREGNGHFGAGIAQFEERGQALGGFDLELLFAHQQETPGSKERMVASTTMAQLFDLDAPTNGVEAPVGHGDQMQGVDDLLGPGKHD
jgi:hypothetical protein